MHFDRDEFDADEELAEHNDHYDAYPRSEFAWLYIAVDTRDMGITKIGLTTKRSPEQRISEGKTYNPFVVLFATYELSKTTNGISRFELGKIEGYIHRRSFADPVLHLNTGRKSEWFYIHPDLAESEVDHMLAKRGFSVMGRYLHTYYEGNHAHNDIYVSRMRHIKKIYRPFPDDFERTVRRLGLPSKYYREYLDYLIEYHSKDAKDKVYL